MSGPVQQFPLAEEYKKKTLITPEDVKKLREWLYTQPHLPSEHITGLFRIADSLPALKTSIQPAWQADLDLILTYHCCNRSAEVAKQVLDLHYTLKTLFTNFFKDRIVDEKILKTFSYYVITPLETRAYDGSAIIYCRLLDYDAKNFVLADVVRACVMVVDLWQYMEGTWPGFMIIIDFDRCTLSHIARLDIQSIQQLIYFLQEAMLLKLKSLHFMTAPSFMDKVMMLLRPFMKKELLDTLTIHQAGTQTIGKFMPVEGLPKEAGGQFKTFVQCQEDTIAKIKNSKEFFIEENKKRVVEAKRPGKPKTISDIFGGVEGSFKKLDID